MARRTARSHRHADLRPFPRVARLNAVVHEVVAEQIERASDADERLALLTVTDVVCEPDMRHAVVYLASLPEGSSEALEEHRREIQSAVGQQTHMKRTPALRFAVDPAIVQGNRVEEALRRAREHATSADREEVEPE